MQSKSEAEAAGLQSELELATEEMERSQQRLATLEREKQGLLTRLQQQQQQAGGGAAGGEEGGEEGAGAGGLAGSGGSKVAEESLRQELYAQVGDRFRNVACCLAPGWATTCTPPAGSVGKTGAQHAGVVPIPCLPRCPSLLQRELATRLQSEVTALRVQLETGGCAEQPPPQLKSFGRIWCLSHVCDITLGHSARPHHLLQRRPPGPTAARGCVAAWRPRRRTPLPWRPSWAAAPRSSKWTTCASRQVEGWLLLGTYACLASGAAGSRLAHDLAACACCCPCCLPTQMRILQAVSGYAAEGEEEGGEQEQGEAAGATAAGGAAAVPAGRALEAALVSKSRHLEHKLTMLRLELAEAKGGCLALLPLRAVRLLQKAS